MRLPRIHVLAILLLLGLSVSAEDEKVKKDTDDDATPLEEESGEENAEELDEQAVDDDLPILPPIILLDFDNGTQDTNSSSEEKTKRTVNGGLGYGFNRNALHSGKYNYYFPAGKTGTTVSIEESISPFLPKTIIEKVQSSSQRQNAARPYPQTGHHYSNYQNNQQNIRYITNPSFGIRTKLHKTTDLNSDFYQSRYTLSSTTRSPIRAYDTSNLAYRGDTFPSTTSSPLRYPEQISYVTPNPLGSIRYETHRPSSSPYRLSSHNSQAYGGHRQAAAQASVAAQSYSTVRPPVQSSTPRTVQNPFPNLPRYTVENGIRYENKIFWKYPDGRVSDTPPVTYVETSYSGLLTTARPEPSPTESSAQNYETVTSESGVYSQGPVQFPLSPESAEQQQASPFISSESISSSIPQQQVYRLGYQNLVGQKQALNLAQQAKTTSGAFTYNFQAPTASPLSLPSDTRSSEEVATSNEDSGVRSSAYTDQRPVSSEYTDRRPVSHRDQRPVSSSYSRLSSSYSRRRPVSKYMVNSPNPEYINPYTTENPVKTTTDASHFTASGEISQDTLSKYTTEAQSYLRKITATKKQPANKHADYSNLQYSDLLSYNPSISQYIKNPASILNVHPTFVQTGNSLIPVIILRVDGAPPIQPKSAPNVNLKALLQQYLLQYAKSIQDVEQSSNYDLGPDLYSGTQNGISATSSPREQDAETQDDYASPYDPYSSGSSYQTRKASVDPSRQSKYGERTSVRQKVKSVQIVEGPRYPAYKVKS